MKKLLITLLLSSCSIHSEKFYNVKKECVWMTWKDGVSSCPDYRLVPVN